MNFDFEEPLSMCASIATCYGLDDLGSNPGAIRFSVPDETGPGALPVSGTVGAGSFPTFKRPERGVNQPLHLSPWLKKG